MIDFYRKESVANRFGMYATAIVGFPLLVFLLAMFHAAPAEGAALLSSSAGIYIAYRQVMAHRPAIVADRLRRSAISWVVLELPRKLRADYGRGPPYSAMQVVRTLERENFPTAFAGYAFAAFLTAEAFAEVSGGDYNVLRADIGDKYFHGAHDFLASDVVSLAADHASHSDGGGGDDGGIGGGHISGH